MPEQRPLSSLIDLTDLTKADALIDDVIRRRKAVQIATALTEAVKSVPLEQREFANAIMAVIADVAAEVEKLAQIFDPKLAKKNYQLNIDPIQHIGNERGETTTPDVKIFELDLDEPMFSGTGWYELSKEGEFSWRWSDSRALSSLVLPTLGGGRLRISASITFLSTQEVDDQTVDILVGGKRIEPIEIRNEGICHVVVFDVDLPEDSGFGQFVLMLRLAEGVRTRENLRAGERVIEFGLMSLKMQLL